MNNWLTIFSLVSSVFLGGCASIRQTPEAVPTEEGAAPMIQIQNLRMADKTLTLHYRISNPLKGAIWVCYDTWVHGEQGVQDASTRIDGEVARIRLCYNREAIGRPAFTNPQGVGKYVRLLPGESHSGRIVQNLPIRDYAREWRAERKARKEIMLRRLIFEIGYLGPKCDDYIASVFESIRRSPDKSKPVILGPYYYLAANPFITEETLDGQLREVMYIEEYTSLIGKEESAEVLIADVDIPCSVVVDDK